MDRHTMLLQATKNDTSGGSYVILFLFCMSFVCWKTVWFWDTWCFTRWSHGIEGPSALLAPVGEKAPFTDGFPSEKASIWNFGTAFGQTTEWPVKWDALALTGRHNDIMILSRTHDSKPQASPTFVVTMQFNTFVSSLLLAMIFAEWLSREAWNLHGSEKSSDSWPI